MVGSIAGANSSGLIAPMMTKAAAQQNLEVAMLKKTQDMQKLQGEAALKLIETAASVSEAGRVDVYV